MKKRILDLLPAILIAAGLLVPGVTVKKTEAGRQTDTRPQVSEQDTSRDQTDYMRSLLERNPQQPLGLQDNPTLKRYLGQPGIKWAIRSARRHILN